MQRPVCVSVQGNLRAANARVCFTERLSKPKNDEVMCASAYDSTDDQWEALTGLASEKSTTPGRMWMCTWCPDDRREEAFPAVCTSQLWNLSLREKKKYSKSTPPFFFASELEL